MIIKLVRKAGSSFSNRHLDLGVVNDILRVNLLLIENDIDARVTLRVHTTVIEGFTICFQGGPDITAAPLGVLSHQDQGNKHDLVWESFRAGISGWVGSISGEVAAWNMRKCYEWHKPRECGHAIYSGFLAAAAMRSLWEELPYRHFVKELQFRNLLFSCTWQWHGSLASISVSSKSFESSPLYSSHAACLKTRQTPSVQTVASGATIISLSTSDRSRKFL